ncbi:MAG: hypothetical protein RR977_02580 [Oscillospiraceae bacterium]
MNMSRTDENTTLLNDIYSNSQMGKKTLEEMLNLVEDNDFLQLLQTHRNRYTKINDTAASLLKKHGEEPKNIPMWDDVSSSLMIKLNTLTDRSASHLAEMLIEGSTMGITDMRKNVNRYQDIAEKEVLDIAKTLLTEEEKNVERLKKFL